MIELSTQVWKAMLRIAGIEPASIVDGPGFRYTIFFQGCSHHCNGCHNPATWDFGGGREQDIPELIEDMSRNPYLDGVTISGGEPFDQPQALVELAAAVKAHGYHIIAFTGYVFEELLAEPARRACLEHIDVLIDGQYMAELRTLSLRFRGSTNQRVIDVQKSLAYNETTYLSF